MTSTVRPVPPTLEDVRAAAAAIQPYLSLPTPLIASPGLSQRWNAEVSLKLELATPTGAFKVRGGIFLASRLSESERSAGLVTASTGNHGQSVAYGAAAFDAKAAIFMPAGANPDKAAAIERLGADVHLVGDRFDDSRAAAEEFAAERGATYVEPVNEPRLLAGVGTAALEVLETQQPDAELVLIPLGGGTGASAWVTVRDALGHPAQIIAAQSAQSPAAHDAFHSGANDPRPNETIAEGLATAVPFAFVLDILRARLNDFVLVDDAEILAALRTLWDLQHIMTEPAGAAAAAAGELLSRTAPERIADKKIVIILTGANATRAQLSTWLAAP